jgi:hypothetical protein
VTASTTGSHDVNVARRQHSRPGRKCCSTATFRSWRYNVAVSQHQIAGPWFWLRGDGGAGQALAGVRHTVGLTQAQIASRLGMDRTTVIDIEAGRNTAVNRFVGLFNRMGYDLIAVPRGARVTVEAGGEGEPVP